MARVDVTLREDPQSKLEIIEWIKGVFAHTKQMAEQEYCRIIFSSKRKAPLQVPQDAENTILRLDLEWKSQDIIWRKINWKAAFIEFALDSAGWNGSIDK